jgi:hypothetical protein
VPKNDLERDYWMGTRGTLHQTLISASPRCRAPADGTRIFNNDAQGALRIFKDDAQGSVQVAFRIFRTKQQPRLCGKTARWPPASRAVFSAQDNNTLCTRCCCPPTWG